MSTFGLSREGGTALVGRRQELAWLRGRLDLAGHGYGHFVLVEGDAGVGKTRLAQALLEEARHAGAVVIRGRCYEHLNLAYLPLREGLLATLTERLSSRSRRGADLALLRRAAGLEERATERGARPLDEERSRQMLALTRLVMELAHEGFLVLFIDDIDWADGATVDLLRHVLFRLDDEQAPLLALVTSRGGLGARDAAGIASLRSDPRAATLRLHALTQLEAAELAREMCPGLGLGQARQLASAAGGNPLLVEALVRQDNAARLAATPSRTSHPLLEAVDAGLGQLDEATNALVRAAAFLVPDSTRELLGEVSGLDSATLERALAEAVDARVLVEDHTTLAFIHPLYAHVLRTQLRPASRRELHARIANVLLARPAGEGEDVRGLAHHLIEAEEAADPGVVFEYTRRAGDEAMAVAAWDEAARCYDAAIGAMPANLDLDEVVTLYRLAGLCHRADLDLDGAVDRFQAAIALVEPGGDAVALTDLHLWRLRCAAGSQDLLDIARDRGPLEGLVDVVEDRRPDLAAEGLVELAQSYWVCGEPDRAEGSARRAMAIADIHNDHESYARATTQLCVPLWTRYNLRESLATLEDGVAHLHAAGGSSILAGGPQFRVPLVLAWLGRFEDAKARANECRALAERVQYPLEEGLPLAALTQVAVARGQFDEAEHHAHQALLIQRLCGYHWAAGLFLPAVMTAHVARGRWASARAALATWEETADTTSQAAIGLLSRYVDACERGHAAEGSTLPRLPRTPTLGIDTWAAAAVEIARREGATAYLDRAYKLLGAIAAQGGIMTSGLVMLVPRLLGVAADLLGDEAAAIAHLHDAIAVAEHLGAEPELAHAQVDLATILLRRRERRAARDLVDRATPVFERLGMIPDSQHAESLAGGHPARTTSDAHVTTGSVVIFFSDVVDSTWHTEELGAARYWSRARKVEELVTSMIAAHGGNVVTGINLGDGFIGLFPSPARALAAARRCAADVGTTGLHLHLAVHRGDVIVDGARIYGGPVNYAARLCTLTGPDEILVSDTIRRGLADLEDVAFVDRGEHQLKGIDGPQRVWSVMTSRETEPAPA